HRARRARSPGRLRPPAGGAAGVAHRPRPPRAADPGGRRRQGGADLQGRGGRGFVPGHGRQGAGAAYAGAEGAMKEPLRWTRKDLLGIAELSREEIELILDTASSFAEVGERPIKKVPTLRGKTVVNLFFESSTRTRSSFEIAEKRLSADNLNFSASGSSLSKGESLVDTALNLQAMAPDLIVIRHAHAGAPHLLARKLKAGVINAGDGAHEHPTQALLDAYTIRRHKGRLA